MKLLTLGAIVLATGTPVQQTTVSLADLQFPKRDAFNPKGYQTTQEGFVKLIKVFSPLAKNDSIKEAYTKNEQEANTFIKLINHELMIKGKMWNFLKRNIGTIASCTGFVISIINFFR